MQSVACKNDNTAYLHVLNTSPDPFLFISDLCLSSLLKYFNDTCKDYTTGEYRVSHAVMTTLLMLIF